jgi:Protein of unknown function (DUF4199)
MERKPINHFVAGIIIAAVIVIYSMALQFMGLGQNKSLGWLAYLFMIVGLIIFISQYAKAKDYQVTFGNLFSYGFKATAIAALIVVVCLLVFFLAFPEYKEKIMISIRQGMEDQGKMSDSQIDTAVSMVEKNFLLFTVGGALFMYLIVGCIGSLIGAAITKKKPFNPLDQLSV